MITMTPSGQVVASQLMSMQAPRHTCAHCVAVHGDADAMVVGLCQSLARTHDQQYEYIQEGDNDAS